jgi:hypothetical protein
VVTSTTITIGVSVPITYFSQAIVPS